MTHNCVSTCSSPTSARDRVSRHLMELHPSSCHYTVSLIKTHQQRKVSLKLNLSILQTKDTVAVFGGRGRGRGVGVVSIISWDVVGYCCILNKK